MVQVGEQVGNYQLIELVGVGGYARVYKAELVNLNTPGTINKQVAIKILETTQLTGNDVDKFRTEARTIASLNHPNIVRLIDYDVENEIPYLVMDFAPNGTLRQRHPEGTVLPPQVILDYVKQVAAALQYVHDQKLIHRDIKPPNMLISPKNEILLSDFGIATVAPPTQTAQQIARSVVGTIDYMAPEQLEGRPTVASDQYSLAIVVYEWLCGTRPFTGPMATVMMQQVNMAPSALRNKVPWISPALEHVVMKALSKDPKHRYASVKEFADALEQAIRQPNKAAGGGGAGTAAGTGTTAGKGAAGAGAGVGAGPQVFYSATAAVPITSGTNSGGQQKGKKRRPKQRSVFARDTRIWRRLNSKSGRYILFGGIGDVVSSIILGLAWHSYWVWLFALIGALVLRWWCASLIRKEIPIGLAVVLALYRGGVGWSLESAITSAIHAGWLPPPGVIAVIFFLISLILNLLYAQSK